MRKISLFSAALLFVGAGCLHFLKANSYVKIMPAYVPFPLAMVYVSGAAEIAGGLGLLIPAVRRYAGWGLVALLIAVFPANVNMAANRIQVTEHPLPAALLWARLPLQLVLIGWVIWSFQSTDAAPHPRPSIQA